MFDSIPKTKACFSENIFSWMHTIYNLIKSGKAFTTSKPSAFSEVKWSEGDMAWFHIYSSYWFIQKHNTSMCTVFLSQHLCICIRHTYTWPEFIWVPNSLSICNALSAFGDEDSICLWPYVLECRMPMLCIFEFDETLLYLVVNRLLEQYGLPRRKATLHSFSTLLNILWNLIWCGGCIGTTALLFKLSISNELSKCAVVGRETTTANRIPKAISNVFVDCSKLRFEIGFVWDWLVRFSRLLWLAYELRFDFGDER